MRYDRKRTNAENNAVNDFVRQLQRDEIDLYTKESKELTPDKVQGLEDEIETLVNKIVTVENGYTGKYYPDPEDLTDARDEVRTRLRNLLITKEGKWNHLELENRLREANGKETQAHTRAEARLVEEISDSMVLEIADQNQDYSYQRDTIKDQIPIVVSEEGYRIYPVDRDQYGVDNNAAKRSDWIQKTNEALELRYFDENLQLRIDAARSSVQYRKEEEQEESRIKSLDNTTRRREASLLLGEQITILEDQFGKGEIDAKTAKERAKQYAGKVFDKFTRKRKGTAPQSEEDKLFNKNLNVDLQGEISAENRGWVRSERLEAEALDKEQKAIERDERAKHLRKKTNEAALSYAKQASELFLEQQKNPKPHEDFERSLVAVKANIIRDIAGDAPDEEIGEELKLIDNKKFIFCWIVDYPMFEEDEKTKRIIG